MYVVFTGIDSSHAPVMRFHLLCPTVYHPAPKLLLQRSVAIRDGVEDFAYLSLLTERFGSRVAAAANCRAVASTGGLEWHTDSVAVLLQARAAAARLLESSPPAKPRFGVKTDDVSFTAHLQANDSTRPCAVVRIEQATVPPATQWFCLRGKSASFAFPDAYHPTVNCSPDCAKDVEQWFPRTKTRSNEPNLSTTQSMCAGVSD